MPVYGKRHLRGGRVPARCNVPPNDCTLPPRRSCALFAYQPATADEGGDRWCGLLPNYFRHLFALVARRAHTHALWPELANWYISLWPLSSARIAYTAAANLRAHCNRAVVSSRQRYTTSNYQCRLSFITVLFVFWRLPCGHGRKQFSTSPVHVRLKFIADCRTVCVNGLTDWWRRCYMYTWLIIIMLLLLDCNSKPVC